MTGDDALAAFVEAACAPLDAGHATGSLERAEALRAAHPDLAERALIAAAILGDAAAVRRHLAADPGGAAAGVGPRGWDPLTHLCFSRYLRLDPARSAGFVDAARALLDAGADPNTGWHERSHQPEPVWESALYGAAGVAHHPGLTRLLLERGADPNDDEVPYHAPETYDNRALEALVESGRLAAESLTVMLIRKCDWHDGDGVRYLLAHGADPNAVSRWGRTALHQAVLRDNASSTIEALLDGGADPSVPAEGRSAGAIAARRGRRDVLEAMDRRGVSPALEGVDRLAAACARGLAKAARALADREPGLRADLLAEGGALLAAFAGVGNTEGVRLLLDLGVPVDASFTAGDGYWDVAPGSTALHVAAWRARHSTVRLLLERGAAPDVPDAKGRTPLALAVKACVDSYWTELRAPDSVEALLRAGASAARAPYPSGYADVDDLLRRLGGRTP